MISLSLGQQPVESHELKAMISCRLPVAGNLRGRNEGDVVGEGEWGNFDPSVARSLSGLALLRKAAVLEGLVANRKIHGTGVGPEGENWQKFRGDLALAEIAVR